MFGETFSESWAAFQQHWKAFAVIGAAMLLALTAGTAIMFAGAFAMTALSAAGSGGELAGAVALIVCYAAGWLFSVGAMIWSTVVMSQAAMMIFAGDPVSFSAARKGISWSTAAAAALWLGLFSVVTFGFGVFILPFVMAMLVPAIVHRDGNGIGCIKASVSAFSSNLLDVFLLVIVTGLISGVAALLCVLPGFFVALPLQALTGVYMYRKITGRHNVPIKSY